MWFALASQPPPSAVSPRWIKPNANQPNANQNAQSTDRCASPESSRAR
jgi:hypothetical protein